MSDLKIKYRCARCLGTGIDDNLDPPEYCSACEGNGFYERDKIDITDLQSDIDKILHRLKKIMDKLDIGE